jgi:hypothetical protein
MAKAARLVSPHRFHAVIKDPTMSIMHKAVAAAALVSASSANASSLQDSIIDSILGMSAVTGVRQMPASPPEGRLEDRLAAAISPPVMPGRASASQSFPPGPSGRGEAEIQDRIIASISARR